MHGLANPDRQLFRALARQRVWRGIIIVPPTQSRKQRHDRIARRSGSDQIRAQGIFFLVGFGMVCGHGGTPSSIIAGHRVSHVRSCTQSMKSVGFGSGNRHKNDINSSFKSLGIRYHFAGQSRGGAARAASAIARWNGRLKFSLGPGHRSRQSQILGRCLYPPCPTQYPLQSPYWFAFPFPHAIAGGYVCQFARPRGVAAAPEGDAIAAAPWPEYILV